MSAQPDKAKEYLRGDKRTDQQASAMMLYASTAARLDISKQTVANASRMSNNPAHGRQWLFVQVLFLVTAQVTIN